MITKKNFWELKTKKGKNKCLNVKRQPTNKIEYFNKLSLERINFEFDCYGTCKDENLQPSILFFKFLCIKPEQEAEMTKRNLPIPRLKLFVPDTIVNNDLEDSSWTYTDSDGNVRRTMFMEDEAITKFRSFSKSVDDLIGVYKFPVENERIIEENIIELLNFSKLENRLKTKSTTQTAVQRFVKCIGPKAFIVRSVWRRNKPPYVYILTHKVRIIITNNKNKMCFQDRDTKYNTYIINTKVNSFVPTFSSSGRHVMDTNKYMNNIVTFIERHSGIIFEELIGDFIK